MLGVDPEPVVNLDYFTVGLGVIIGIIYVAYRFIKIKSLPAHGFKIGLLTMSIETFPEMAIGMLTGSRTTSHNTIFSFFGPALTSKV